MFNSVCEYSQYCMAAILKMTATAHEGTIASAPISEDVRNTSKYMCENVGAFITKWTIGPFFVAMPLH